MTSSGGADYGASGGGGSWVALLRALLAQEEVLFGLLIAGSATQAWWQLYGVSRSLKALKSARETTIAELNGIPPAGGGGGASEFPRAAGGKAGGSGGWRRWFRRAPEQASGTGGGGFDGAGGSSSSGDKRSNGSGESSGYFTRLWRGNGGGESRPGKDDSSILSVRSDSSVGGTTGGGTTSSSSSSSSSGGLKWLLPVGRSKSDEGSSSQSAAAWGQRELGRGPSDASELADYTNPHELVLVRGSVQLSSSPSPPSSSSTSSSSPLSFSLPKLGAGKGSGAVGGGQGSGIELGSPPAAGAGPGCSPLLPVHGAKQPCAVVERSDVMLYSELHPLLGWVVKSEQVNLVRQSVPFSLADTSHLSAPRVDISLVGATQPLPLHTVYSHMQKADPSWGATALHVLIGKRLPVGLRTDERVLPINHELTAVGHVRRRSDGRPAIFASPKFPFFLFPESKAGMMQKLNQRWGSLLGWGVLLSAAAAGVIGLADVPLPAGQAAAAAADGAGRAGTMLSSGTAALLPPLPHFPPSPSPLPHTLSGRIAAGKSGGSGGSRWSRQSWKGGWRFSSRGSSRPHHLLLSSPLFPIRTYRRRQARRQWRQQLEQAEVERWMAILLERQQQTASPPPLLPLIPHQDVPAPASQAAVAAAVGAGRAGKVDGDSPREAAADRITSSSPPPYSPSGRTGAGKPGGSGGSSWSRQSWNDGWGFSSRDSSRQQEQEEWEQEEEQEQQEQEQQEQGQQEQGQE
ncbi:unnamed protein product [Closterium sp. NIES-65]|nr:unnamed protein product [Closterium sp. NIES-65]